MKLYFALTLVLAVVQYAECAPAVASMLVIDHHRVKQGKDPLFFPSLKNLKGKAPQTGVEPGRPVSQEGQSSKPSGKYASNPAPKMVPESREEGDSDFNKSMEGYPNWM